MQIKHMKSQRIEIKKKNSKDQMFDSQLTHTNKSFQEKNVDRFI
jgi:hypothetical protein